MTENVTTKQVDEYTAEQEAIIARIHTKWDELKSASTSIDHDLRNAVNALVDAVAKLTNTFPGLEILTDEAYESAFRDYNYESASRVAEGAAGQPRNVEAVGMLRLASYVLDDAEGFFRLYAAAELFEFSLEGLRQPE